MAEGRMLKKEISDSKKLGRLPSDRPRVLYFMMLPYLDVKGRLYADPQRIKGQIVTMLPYSAAAIQKALEQLHEVGLIVLYQKNSDQYLEYTRFDDFQKLNTDREAESKILAPTPEDSRGLLRTQENSPLSLSLSKDKLSKDNITVIFEKWNFYKGKKKWKSHSKMSYEIEQAIVEQLKHYSAEDLCVAIDNYAKVLLSPDFKWSYAWTLQQFLTRTSPQNRKEQQLWRWLPNNYHDDDYLTDSVKQRRIAAARQRHCDVEAEQEMKRAKEANIEIAKKRKAVREKDGPKFAAMKSEQLQAILDDRVSKLWLTHGWLIKEILAERK